jgi:hypothetical protein
LNLDTGILKLITTVIVIEWFSGADSGFKVRGAHLKKLRRAEGGAKNFGVFRVKITILRQKILFFPILAGWSTRRRRQLIGRSRRSSQGPEFQLSFSFQKMSSIPAYLFFCLYFINFSHFKLINYKRQCGKIDIFFTLALVMHINYLLC